MPAYPLMLNLAQRRVVVVGGGPVATRKVHNLIAADADVAVIAPQASDDIAILAAAGTLNWLAKPFDSDDIGDAWLVIAATNDADLNLHICEICEASRIWCVNTSDGSRSSATNAASATLDNAVTVAVSGNGDPQRAQAVRDFVQLLNRLDALPTEVSRGIQKTNTGKVYLVGAGPGDPSLLTLRAVEAIRQADVLVVDRLAPQVIWEGVPAIVEVVDVGKAPGRHAASQDEINALLVRHGLSGKTVARIKGGDPFILGRGGEEADACIQAGIPVEIVPGITSAIAVPAAAGIPMTHRGVTSSFIVASAHEGPEGVVRAVADAPHSSTLALLMGAGALPAIAKALVGTGRDPETPVAIVGSGWTPNQTVIVTNLGEAAARKVQVPPPAVVVIGDVVKLREQLGSLAFPSQKAGHA